MLLLVMTYLTHNFKRKLLFKNLSLAFINKHMIWGNKRAYTYARMQIHTHTQEGG